MWPVFAIVFSLLCIIYCLLILKYRSWLRRLKQFSLQNDLQPVHKFSVIVPARNEEQNIERCIISIYNNDYRPDLFEVIVADDFSDDATVEIVNKLRQKFSTLRLIRLNDFIVTPLNSYKKKAIEIAIEHSSFEWIITTDADCEVPEQWLKLFDAYIQRSNTVFVAAPVKLQNNRSLLSVFQSLDFMSLQGIGAASVSAGFLSMCNGANLAYQKAAFYNVDGFKGVDNIASGDDMLLMHKIKDFYPSSIGYLFNSRAFVTTIPMQTWRGFFNQRIRWASKATSYTDRKIFLVLLLVYLFNFSLVAMFVAIFFIPKLITFFIAGLLLKIFCELLFMIPVAKFFDERHLLWKFPLMQPLHILYTIISGWLGKFGKYNWKGRAVK